MTTTSERPALAVQLGLDAHPEGGWFRRTWTSPAVIATPGGMRPAATCIQYLLAVGERSAWHVVTSDEIWMWHGPGALSLTLGGDGEAPGLPRTVVLGPDIADGHLAQCLVPAGVWQAAVPAGERDVLVTCVVSPGFSFDDWRLAD